MTITEISASSRFVEQETIRLPQTSEAKFFRESKIFPDADQDVLEDLAIEYNCRFNCDASWTQMPNLLRWALGQLYPRDNSDGYDPESKRKGSQFHKRAFLFPRRK